MEEEEEEEEVEEEEEEMLRGGMVSASFKHSLTSSTTPFLRASCSLVSRWESLSSCG